MRLAKMGLLLSSCIALSACSTSYSVAPIPDASQEIRYQQGTPTTYSEMDEGALQVTALGVNDERRLIFSVAAFNKGSGPSNFGVENISIEQQDGSPDQVFTSGELIHEAKVKAAWATFATALAGGLAAAAANNNAYTTTSGYIGHHSFYMRTYDPGLAYAGTAAASAATAYGIANIQDSLDHSIANIRDGALQTTTIDPDNSYAGIVMAAALQSSQYPQNITMHVRWNGDDHVFRFAVGKGDIPPPVPANIAQTPTPVAPHKMLASAPPKPTRTEFKSFSDWSKDDATAN